MSQPCEVKEQQLFSHLIHKWNNKILTSKWLNSTRNQPTLLDCWRIFRRLWLGWHRRWPGLGSCWERSWQSRQGRQRWARRSRGTVSGASTCASVEGEVRRWGDVRVVVKGGREEGGNVEEMRSESHGESRGHFNFLSREWTGGEKETEYNNIKLKKERGNRDYSFIKNLSLDTTF